MTKRTENVVVWGTLAILMSALLWGVHKKPDAFIEPKTNLTWLCFDIDGERSALAIEPAGEGSFDFGDKPAKKLSVHLCRDGKSWVHHDTVNTP